MKEQILLSKAIYSPSITPEIRENLINDYPKMDDDTLVRRMVYNISDTLEINDEERVAVGYISTREVDRHGTILCPEGVRLSNYELNPIILWEHDGLNPVGRALEMQVDSYGIRAKTHFDGIGSTGIDTWDKVKARTLVGFSVRFLDRKGVDNGARGWSTLTKKLSKDWNVPIESFDNVRRILTEWELIEVSVVSVPSNPRAIIDGVSTRSNDDEVTENEPIAIEGVETIAALEVKEEIIESIEQFIDDPKESLVPKIEELLTKLIDLGEIPLDECPSFRTIELEECRSIETIELEKEVEIAPIELEGTRSSIKLHDTEYVKAEVAAILRGLV